MLARLAETHAAAGDRAKAELYRQRSLLAPAADRARRLHEALSLDRAQGSRSLARRIQVSLDNI